MAQRFIEKGEIDEKGLRRLMCLIEDQDGTMRREVFERVPDDQADTRIEELVNGGQWQRWPAV